MPHPTPRPSRTRPARHGLVSCLLLGLALGQVVLAMAAHRPGDLFSFVMAMVCLTAASASMVSYLLGRTPAAQAAASRAQVPAWLLAIAAGVLLMLHLSPP